jgi:hypothetical protein
VVMRCDKKVQDAEEQGKEGRGLRARCPLPCLGNPTLGEIGNSKAGEGRAGGRTKRIPHERGGG